MRKHLKSLMGGLLVACMCLVLPLVADAASPKSSASEDRQVKERATYEASENTEKANAEVKETQTLAAPSSFTGKWMEDSRGWWFKLTVPFEGCSYLRDAYVTIGGSYYYFDMSGYMVTGWYQSNGEWYYFASSGAQQFGWTKVGASWYYLDKTTGAMASSEWIYADRDGDGYEETCYFVSSSGRMLENQWLETSNAWYYYGAGGVEARGWTKIGAYWYYFDTEDGELWYDTWMSFDSNGDGSKETWYYLDVNGRMYANQWLYDNGDWYYYGASGAEARGWTKVGAYWYYFDPDDGNMYTGWFHADEKYNDGVGDTWYYLGDSGAMRTGWINTDEDGDNYAETWYYQGADGRGYTCWHKIGGVWYHFEEEYGAMLSNGTYYLACDGAYAKFAASGAFIKYVY